MKECELKEIFESIKSSSEYQGQLISRTINPITNNHYLQSKAITDNTNIYGNLLNSFFIRNNIEKISSVQVKIIERILAGKDTYILSTISPFIKNAIGLSILLQSYYHGKKIIYVTLNANLYIEFLEEIYGGSIEFNQLNISQEIDKSDVDILVIQPSKLFSLINSDNNEKYPISLLYENIVIDNIHLYNNRELNHLSEIIIQFKNSRRIYDLDPEELNITITSTPLKNRQEIASFFFNHFNENSIIYDDDTRSENFSFYFWKPALQTESKIEAVDKIKIDRGSIYNEVIKLLKAIKSSSNTSKILLWVNEIGLSKDFNLNLRKVIKNDNSELNFSLKSINRLESLKHTDSYTFDIILIVNPSKISGFFLEQCSKLVNGKDSAVVLFLGEDHLSNQLLRSKEYSLNWNDESFNLPLYFILKSSKIKEFYDNSYNDIINKFSDLYKNKFDNAEGKFIDD